MNYNKKSVKDVALQGKRVLCRCDFNVPLKAGEITSDKRIVAALPTIRYLIDHGAKVILCSHMGKPKGEFKPELSLYFNGSEPGSDCKTVRLLFFKLFFPMFPKNMRHDSYRLQKTVYTLTDDNYIISFILLVRSPRLNRMIPAASAIAQPIGIAVQIAPTPNNGAHA